MQTCTVVVGKTLPRLNSRRTVAKLETCMIQQLLRMCRDLSAPVRLCAARLLLPFILDAAKIAPSRAVYPGVPWKQQWLFCKLVGFSNSALRRSISRVSRLENLEQLVHCLNLHAELLRKMSMQEGHADRKVGCSFLSYFNTFI